VGGVRDQDGGGLDYVAPMPNARYAELGLVGFCLRLAARRVALALRRADHLKAKLFV
jgi:hypothetical protein